jgi:hypothetical protein
MFFSLMIVCSFFIILTFLLHSNFILHALFLKTFFIVIDKKLFLLFFKNNFVLIKKLILCFCIKIIRIIMRKSIIKLILFNWIILRLLYIGRVNYVITIVYNKLLINRLRRIFKLLKRFFLSIWCAKPDLILSFIFIQFL